MRSLVVWWALGACLVVGGCNRVHSSAVATGGAQAPWTGQMYLAGARVPPPSAEVGIAQAAGPTTIEELVPELMQRARELGGNFARIERVSTRFEIGTRTVQSSYNCGTVQQPRTCWRTQLVQEEYGITQIIARVYRVEGWQ